MLRHRFIPASKPIVAIGDIHGEAAMLDLLLDEVEQLAADQGGASIVTLGDYIDRGSSSRQVLERLIEGPRLACNDYFHLVGNHDLMLLAAHANPTGREMQRWIMVGGVQTLISYGLDDEDWLNDGRWRQLVPQTHLDFLEDAHHLIEAREHILVHAGLRPGIALHQQSVEDLTWIRKDFLLAGHDFGRLVVHGHTITRDPFMGANHLAIDTGANLHGVMTAAFLEERPRFIQSVRAERTQQPCIRHWHDPQGDVVGLAI